MPGSRTLQSNVCVCVCVCVYAYTQMYDTQTILSQIAPPPHLVDIVEISVLRVCVDMVEGQTACRGYCTRAVCEPLSLAKTGF